MFAPNPILGRVLAFAMLVSSTVGCSTLTLFPSMSNPGQPATENSAEPVVVAAQSVASCMLVVRSARGQVRRIKVPITEGMTVQDVMETNQVSQLFPRMKIQLKRPTDKSYQPLIMPVKYHRTDKQVNPAYNYAVRQGDLLVISEDTSNVLDDMLDGVLTPLGISAKR